MSTPPRSSSHWTILFALLLGAAVGAAMNALVGDSLKLAVLRRQVDVRRDVASVWVTLREHRRVAPDSTRDTTRYEHLLLRRSSAGWVVLNAAPVSAP